MTRLTIDLRMYRHSGIGRYLRNLIPALLPLLQVDRIRVLGSAALFDRPAWLAGPTRDPRVELREIAAPIYSPQEQLLSLQGAYADTTLLWVPHYNAPLLFRGRLVLTIHDVAPLALPEILGSRLKSAYARLLITRAVARASAILCDSAYTAGELQQHAAADPAKLTVAHLGIDEAWQITAAPHREPDGTPYLLYVGNVKPNKNLTLLLSAFARLGDRLPHRLILAGRMRGFGSGDDAVLRQAESLGARVRFTDQISDPELISLYAGATALVLPSLYEGFGLPLLEAMQVGCPILCSNATSLPEIAGDAALLFDPHSIDSLVGCLLQITDPPLLERLRQAGQRRLPLFSYRQCAQTTAAVLNRQLHRPA